ncbi:MAG: bifunctional transaldolase/phosoglucose isomerase, partial [Candidatus Saccharicenans sp.]
MKLEFFNLNPWASDLNQSRQEIIKIQFIDRLFQRDFTLWKEKDEEISNRLGWLNSPLKIKPFLESYARQAEDFRASGIKLIVLLGMGGSSLAPEALSQLAGPRPGYPEFKVLDSTCPAMVKEVGRQTEKKPTLFIVSSKSGTTTETLSLFNYFYHQQVEIYGFEAGK